MRWVRGLTALFMVALCLATAAPVAAAQPVLVRGSIADTSGVITVRGSAETSIASTQIFLAAVRGTNPSRVRFSLSELTRTDPAGLAPAVLPGAVLSITVNRRAVTNGGLQIPSGGGFVAAVFKLDGLTAIGAFQADLLGRVGSGPSQRLATVRVERYPDPALNLVGVVDNELSVTAVGPTLSRDITIRLASRVGFNATGKIISVGMPVSASGAAAHGAVMVAASTAAHKALNLNISAVSRFYEQRYWW